MNTETEI